MSGIQTRFTAWRQDASSHAGKHAFVPLKFRWGEAFQFDWSEESLVVGGVYRRLCSTATSNLSPASPVPVWLADTARYEQLREAFDIVIVDEESGDA